MGDYIQLGGGVLFPPVLNVWCLFVFFMSCFWWLNLLRCKKELG